MTSRVDKDSLPLNQPRRTPSHPTKSHIVKTKVDGKEKIIRFGEQGASTAGKPKEGESDRRQRLLYLTEAGEELRQRLMGPQISRIRRAVALPEGNAAQLYRKVLFHMVSPANREAVLDWIGRASLLGDTQVGG